MHDCPFQPRLGAFYDRELEPTLAQQLESHLGNCPACAAELRKMQSVTRLFTDAPLGRMSQMGLARLHHVADEAAAGPAVFPMARALMAAAASVLIIAGAWLVEIPRPAAHPVVGAPVVQSPWETLASGGKLDFPRDISDNTALASRRFSQWMVQNLEPDGSYENPSR